MLHVQKYIFEHGLEKTVNDFKLVLKEYPHKILLKYNQIESPMQFEETRDCRGLVLDKNFEVMSLGLRKFFNYGEGHAAKLDWENSKIYKKLDGTFIHVYWDKYLNRWEVGTTGTADGMTPVNNKPNTTFRSLFLETYDKNSDIDNFYKKADKGLVYMFECCSPWNIVVTPHSIAMTYLLAIRKLSSMGELNHDEVEKWSKELNVQMAETYELSKDPEFLKETLLNLPYTEEGYVVTDKNFNRVKIKNPAYLAVHHMADATANWRIIDVVRSNEIEEFAATFVDRKEELYELKENYDNLLYKLEEMWLKVKDIEVRKDFALNVLDMCKTKDLKLFQSFFFSMKDNKFSNSREFLKEYDGKYLYKYLTR